MNELVKDLNKCQIGIYALQEITWSGKGTVIKKNFFYILGIKETNMNLENYFILVDIYG